VVCDIDGVLADCSHRLHHIKKEPPDWEAFFAECPDDKAISVGIALLDQLVDAMYSMGSVVDDIYFVTGRTEEWRRETRRWLVDNITNYSTFGLSDEYLIMRPEGDHRPDYVFKGEAYDKIAEENPDCSLLIIDDNICNVEEAVKRGYTALHFRRPGEDVNQAVGKMYAIKNEESVK
jgi:hypothetical protein